ncbi:DNA polymerase family A [Leishmania braziliensis]|nr:DNA polymerase family A [Leishmania braziliensis]
MDPFQRTADVTRYSFRVVPMTHRNSTAGAKPSGSACSIPGGSPSSPSARGGAPAFGNLASGLPQCETTAWRQPSFREPLESEETTRNVDKWRQFGLQMGTAVASQALPPLEQQQGQRLQPQTIVCHRPEQDTSTNSSLLYRQNTRLHSAEAQNEVQLRRQCRLNRAAALALPPHDEQSSAHASPWPLPEASSRVRAVVKSALDNDDVVVLSDDGEHHTDGENTVCQRQTVKPPPRSVSRTDIRSPAPATLSQHAPDTSDGACADVTRQLQAELAKLSEKVQHSSEAQRCGPPKRNGGGEPSLWAAKHWGGKKRRRETKTTHHNDGDEEAEAREGSERDETSAAMQGRSTSSTDARRKLTARRRDCASTDTAADVSTEKRKRKTRGHGGDDAIFHGVSNQTLQTMLTPRTLFSLASSEAGGSAMSNLQSEPAAVATISVPYVYLQDSAEGLFSDVRRALNDPDRIQAPPLFVGVLALSGNRNATTTLASVECRTNFTYYGSGAKTAKHRVSCCFSSPDPVRSHQHVELVLIRWKDDMYGLPAQTVGLTFLCRILTELPGVELITFNAQVLLVALLAYCKGTLWSYCVSDVRVMAWMAQLHMASTLPKPPSPAYALAGEGSATTVTGASDTDSSVLYDYGQLLLHVCGGKLPPNVQLEKTSPVERLSPARGSFAESTGTAVATTPAPPLTPAQRQLAHQVYYLATVYRSLYGLLGSKGLLQAFLRQEKRIAPLLALLKYNGMPVDLHEVRRYQMSCETEMARQRGLAHKLVPELGEEFNIQSHDQCRKALYEVLQLGKYLVQSESAEAVGTTGLIITKGGRLSTAEDTLRALARHHEFPACLLRYRKVSKLMQTYIEGMMSYAVVRSRSKTSPPLSRDGVGTETETSGAREGQQQLYDDDERAVAERPSLLREGVDVNDDSPFVDRRLHAGNNRHSPSGAEPRPARNQRNGEEEAYTMQADEVILPATGYATLHPNFLQEGTDTGRLSCVEPNLQNLPRNGITSTEEEGEEDLLGFRRCFVAAAGCVLLSIDYQQIELRVLAHLCGDPALVKALTSSADIHQTIAEVVFKKKPVSTEERSLAKRVVFGVLYGAGPKTLATHMGVTVDRALHITSLLTNAFPGINTYHRRVIAETRANGFVRTLSGRLRYLPDICSTVLSRRSYAERQAFNSVVQGSAADVMKMAMLAVSKEVLQRYDRSDVSLLSQIHDEMVFMVRKEHLRTVVPLLSSAMSHAMQLLVPLSVTVKFGTSLGDLQEWSVEHDLGVG